jgi:high-affinity iron transporter
MLASFLIGLREGLEASLIVSILVAYLVKTDRRSRLGAVWIGVIVAIALSLGVGALLTFTSARLDFQAQEAFGGGMSVLAVVLVTWMIFWMRRTARSMKSELEHKLEAAIAMGTTALVITAFVSVAREGIETALFLWGAVKWSNEGAWPVLSAVAGLLLAAALAWGLYRRAVKINLAKFFTWTGAGLVIVAAGVLGYGLHDLQEGGVLPGLNSLAFDVSEQIPPGGVLGTLLKGILNFTPNTTWLQAVAWVLYVVPTMYFFLRPQRKPAVAPKTAQPAEQPANEVQPVA